MKLRQACAAVFSEAYFVTEFLPCVSVCTGRRIMDAIPPERGMAFPERGSLYFAACRELVLKQRRSALVIPLLIVRSLSEVKRTVR